MPGLLALREHDLLRQGAVAAFLIDVHLGEVGPVEDSKAARRCTNVDEGSDPESDRSG